MPSSAETPDAFAVGTKATYILEAVCELVTNLGSFEVG